MAAVQAISENQAVQGIDIKTLQSKITGAGMPLESPAGEVIRTGRGTMPFFQADILTPQDVADLAAAIAYVADVQESNRRGETT